MTCQPNPAGRCRDPLRHSWSATPLLWIGSPNLLTRWTGHSERRTLFGETSAVVAEKTRAALDAGLRVILCVGETLAEREAGRTQQVVEEQLQAVVAQLSPEDWRFVT
jgi:triosephosphate isomerase (TIM)